MEVGGGAAEGSEADPALLPLRPVEDVELRVMAFDWIQASDRRPGGCVNEREAAIAPLRGQRAGVEPEGFDRVDDFLIGHRVIVANSAAAVLRQPLGGR